MSIQICTNNSINLDHEPVKLTDRSIGLFVTQRQERTVVYSAGHGGLNYKEYTMPHARYSLAHPSPRSGVAGVDQFEADIRALLAEIMP